MSECMDHWSIGWTADGFFDLRAYVDGKSIPLFVRMTKEQAFDLGHAMLSQVEEADAAGVGRPMTPLASEPTFAGLGLMSHEREQQAGPIAARYLRARIDSEGRCWEEVSDDLKTWRVSSDVRTPAQQICEELRFRMAEIREKASEMMELEAAPTVEQEQEHFTCNGYEVTLPKLTGPERNFLEARFLRAKSVQEAQEAINLVRPESGLTCSKSVERSEG